MERFKEGLNAHAKQDVRSISNYIHASTSGPENRFGARPFETDLSGIAL